MLPSAAAIVCHRNENMKVTRPDGGLLHPASNNALLRAFSEGVSQFFVHCINLSHVSTFETV